MPHKKEKRPARRSSENGILDLLIGSILNNPVVDVKDLVNYSLKITNLKQLLLSGSFLVIQAACIYAIGSVLVQSPVVIGMLLSYLLLSQLVDRYFGVK